jgi:ABC-type lipoprotein export system ATPase subunit
MNIRFSGVMPLPLKNIQHKENSLWSKSFSFPHGTTTCVDAASGKGKTTFTHILAGLRHDFEGEVRFDERDIRTFNHNEWSLLRQEKLAFVFQDLQLFNQLTVMENLRIKNQLMPVFSEEELVMMLDQLGIGDKINAPCHQISMGQQQRVAIVRALCQPFEILVMDEPFSHLDEQSTQICLELVSKECKRRNAGFILTTLGESYGLTFDQNLFI